MISFFEYNWQIRDEWFDWCNQLSNNELVKSRTGGVGSILYTLFHIIDVEYSWIRGIQGKEDVVINYADYSTVEKIRSLSDGFRIEIAHFLINHLNKHKEKAVSVPWDNDSYSVEEVLHHVIAHEIHHVGQLSIWSRELKLDPVAANFIGREFNSIHL